MIRFVLKRTEFIEVFATDEDQALDKFGEGLGEHVHEIEEIYEEQS